MFEPTIMDSNDSEKPNINRAKISLWCAMIDGSSRVIKASFTEWYGNERNLYRDEKMILQKHMITLYAGVFTTMFMFSLRRIGRSSWYRNFRLEQLASSTESPTSVGSSATKVSKSITKTDRRRQIEATKIDDIKSRFFRGMHLPVDIALSTFSGCAIFFAFRTSGDFAEDALALPLVAGGSIVHKYACHEMEQAYEDEGGDHIFDHITKRRDEATMRWFQSIIRNCRLRSEQIHARKEASIAKPEIIPFPGVQSPEV
jgi:hypothetical protein